MSEATLHSGCSPGLPLWLTNLRLRTRDSVAAIAVCPSPVLSPLALGLSGLSKALLVSLSKLLILVAFDPAVKDRSQATWLLPPLWAPAPSCVCSRKWASSGCPLEQVLGVMPPTSCPTSHFPSFLWGGGWRQWGPWALSGKMEPVQSRKLLLDTGFRAELGLGVNFNLLSLATRRLVQPGRRATACICDPHRHWLPRRRSLLTSMARDTEPREGKGAGAAFHLPAHGFSRLGSHEPRPQALGEGQAPASVSKLHPGLLGSCTGWASALP